MAEDIETSSVAETVDAERLTPMMRQYRAAKDAHPGSIVLFRMGDFFETFFDDAQECARLLEIQLTKRSKEKDAPPMAGVPARAIDGYVARLIEAGRTVVFVDQIEDPKLAKGLVKRAVTRIATPGTFSDENTPRRTPIYLGALGGLSAKGKGKAVGLAALDVSTGEFIATSLSDVESLLDELGRLGVRELLCPASAAEDPRVLRLQSELPSISVTFRPPETMSDRPGRAALVARWGEDEVAGLSRVLAPEALEAAGSALAYATETQLAEESLERKAGGNLGHLAPLRPYAPGDALILDNEARTHLELFATAGDGGKRGSMFSVIDLAVTAMGGRLLARWLSRPLIDVSQIRDRARAVGVLVRSQSVRDALRKDLRDVHDLERLLGRITMGRATPRDLGSLVQSLDRAPEVLGLAGEALTSELVDPPQTLARIVGCDTLLEVKALLSRALVDAPPLELGEDPVFRDGFDSELDRVVGLNRDGKEIVSALEAREQARTGISSLRVRYNRVFGYFIEVTKSNLDKVPKDYIRKQTTAQSERYYTPELKEHEEEILGASEKRLAIEERLFKDLRARVAAEAVRIRALAEALATLDALASLAHVADQRGWVEPSVDTSDRLRIVEGRHPVLETTSDKLVERFIPNDVELSREASLMILTGPNMAGKSTIMRQAAEIVILAQMGSFVPAREVSIGVVDRIFTRVGASDDLSRGRSTFMVEMTETARILRSATPNSLILFDEIGRGTSTFDGLAIAWAVAEHVHDVVRARTIFATHYHELTEICREKERARNYHVAVKELGDRIVFLRKLAAGPTNKSYGVHVAKLAGLPKSVIGRAKEVLGALEAHDLAAGVSRGRQLFLFAASSPRQEAGGEKSEEPASSVGQEILGEMRSLDLDAMSPREVYALLGRWRERLEQE